MSVVGIKTVRPLTLRILGDRVRDFQDQGVSDVFRRWGQGSDNELDHLFHTESTPTRWLFGRN